MNFWFGKWRFIMAEGLTLTTLFKTACSSFFLLPLPSCLICLIRFYVFLCSIDLLPGYAVYFLLSVSTVYRQSPCVMWAPCDLVLFPSVFWASTLAFAAGQDAQYVVFKWINKARRCQSLPLNPVCYPPLCCSLGSVPHASSVRAPASVSVSGTLYLASETHQLLTCCLTLCHPATHATLLTPWILPGSQSQAQFSREATHTFRKTQLSKTVRIYYKTSLSRILSLCPQAYVRFLECTDGTVFKAHRVPVEHVKKGTVSDHNAISGLPFPSPTQQNRIESYNSCCSA